MKKSNVYDIHSVYLKSTEKGSENWARIEGVEDSEARLEPEKINQNYSKNSSGAKIKISLQKSSLLIPGAVRRIVKLFK